MDDLRKSKVFFINTLKSEIRFLLNHVQQDDIITTREYSNLHDSKENEEQITIHLLNKVMAKGNNSCIKFLALLKTKAILETFPELHKHFTPPSTEVKGVTSSQISEYKMSSDPRGLCLIINNMEFTSPHKSREGSEFDEASLKEVFQWLGFKLKVVQNLPAEQIKNELRSLSQDQHDGDCFVCCILSHGSCTGVCGTDGGIVTKDDIISPFSGRSCPSLAGKPKVFFIQACRGKDKQEHVEVQSDDIGETVEDEEAGIDMDVLIEIPDDADFLVVRSTVKGFVSFRSTISGSWFIQTLCKKLKEFCPKGEDIQAILLSVNEEVSKKSVGYKNYKQMPIHKVTLRKKLVFHVPDQKK